MDPDQSDHTEQSDLDPHCLSMRLQIFLWAKKKHTLCDYAL